MKVLAIDSSGLTATVALVEEAVTLAEYTIHYKKTHSQTLLPMIDSMAEMVELELSEIDAIAVAGGPGSFTGLRIGSATAKGLGLALEKPLIHVPTVDALAYNLYGCRDLICPIMDARRQQVYTGVYAFVEKQGDQKGEIKEELCVLEPQTAISVEELILRLNQRGKNVVFLGDGVPVYKKMLEDGLEVPYTFAPAHMNRQRAASVGALGIQYLKAGNCESARDHRPDYLRVSQAERERAEREKSASTQVRLMTIEDSAAVAEMEHQIFSDCWSEKALLGTLENAGSICLLAERAGRRVGYLIAYDAVDNVEIARIAVAEEMRKQGIAGCLMRELKKQCAQQGKEKILLDVRESNAEAIRLYRKEGFSEDGIRKGFYENPGEDALLMSFALSGEHNLE